MSAPEPGDRGPTPRPTPPRGRDAWEVYERLLADVPAGPRIAECTCGLVWTLVQAETGAAGIALTFADGVFSSALPGTLGGLAWRDLAAGVTNWNLFEAGLGTAALNAHFNDRARVEALLGHAVDEGEQRGVFALLAERFAGGRVAVVGHFPDLSPFAQACELTILERRPRDGDLPDQACEYVLPRQDCVCITGSAFTNKTLPRLLELSRHAYVALVGPSVPLSALWFEYGVDLLAGSVVTDAESVRKAVEEGAHRGVFAGAVARVLVARDPLPPAARGVA